MSRRAGGVLLAMILSVPAPFASAAEAAGSDLAALSDALQRLAERVGPSVVEVRTSGFAAPTAGDGRSLVRQLGSGSGVVVSGDGYIVTNAHVVRGATRVQVVLPPGTDVGGVSILQPGGEPVTAQLLGTDDETDLALLHVEAQGLAFLEFGDSEALHQGQLVLAVGTPFGLERSVTLGVVSSVARQLTPEDPMIYVQTDAPINPGSSGGALVDAHGRLVGINTLIFSQSGGNDGIGFAAPSNIVQAVYEQLRDAGRVRRGEIGVRTQTITPALARALDLPRDHGVLVRDVVAKSAAERAGLRLGDVITTLDGKPMENARQFQVNVYRRAVGSPVPLEVLRRGETLRFAPVVAERPGDPAGIADLVTPARNLVRPLGILALDVDDRVLERMPDLRARAGVIVAAGGSGSGALEDSLQPGDVIYTINGDSVTSVERLRTRLRAFEDGEFVAVQVEREGELRYVLVTLDAPHADAEP